MLAPILTAAVFGLFSYSCQAFDETEFNSTLQSAVEKLDAAGRKATVQGQLYDGASVLANMQDSEVRILLLGAINTLNSIEDLQRASELVSLFEVGRVSQQVVSSMVVEQLRRKAAFLGFTEEAPRATVQSIVADLKPVIPQEFLRPEDFMMVKVDSATGVVFASSKRWDDRKAHLEGILKRHECDVVSSFHWDDDEESHNFLINCKDFVTKALVEHYGGEINPAFEVEVEFKTGGWFTSKKKTVSIAGTAGSEKQSLSYLQSMIENQAFQYVMDQKVADLTEMGKVKEVAGQRALVLKNARAKFWLKAAGTTQAKAVYHSEKSYGDLVLKGGF